MSKLPIKDPSVNVIPSPAFRKFIASRFSHDSLLPKTLQNICKNNFTKCSKLDTEVPESAVEFTEEEHIFLKAQNKENNQMEHNLDEDRSEDDVKIDDILKTGSQNISANTLTLSINDLKWLHQALNRLRKSEPDIPYLHELMANCEIVLPENEIQERNPELEARCQKLRKQQEAKEYQAMTRNVDNVRTLMPQDTIAYQSMNVSKCV